jgi:hypothetical protein
MRKGILALEGLEEEIAVAPETEIRADLAEAEMVGAEAEMQSDQIAEATEISGSLDQLGDQLQISVQTGEGASEETLKSMEVAVEHFCKRLGYGKKVMPSLEGFVCKETQLAKTQLALENIAALNKQLGQSIQVSQEGFMDTIKHRVSRLFATQDKMAKRLESVSTGFDAKTAVEKEMVNPPWGKLLSDGKSHVNGADAVKTLAEHAKNFTSTKLIDGLHKINESLDKAITAMGKSTFIADDKMVARINAELAVIIQITEKITEEDSAKGKAQNATFTPLTAADKNKLVSLLSTLLVNKKMSEAIDDVEKTMFSFARSSAPNLRLAGWEASDVKATQACMEMGWKSLNAGCDIVNHNVVLCHAVMAYIEASAK